MRSFLLTVHPWSGYLVFVALLATSVMGFSRAKDAREFRPAPFLLTMVLLDIQVLLGLVLYGVGTYWDGRPELAYLHPLIGLVALGVGHGALRRARSEQMAVAANRLAGKGMLVTLILVTLSIGIASAPAFL